MPDTHTDQQKTQQSPHRRLWGGLRIVRNILLVLLETVLLAAAALYGVMFVLCKGPSPTARNLFVLSVRETSAVKFLANFFFTDEEIALMESPPDVTGYLGSDPSLITIPSPPPQEETGGSGEQQPETPPADPWGLVDEDGDGIIVEPVHGECWQGYMMVVLDPSRVVFASVPASFGTRGYTVEQMVKHYDAVAGVNAGGFYDPDGHGNGSIPDSLVVSGGAVYYPELGTRHGFSGFDRDHILHVGSFTIDELHRRGIQSGVCFGPVLISDGEPRPTAAMNSGVNPRTGIGQRSDGAVLLLVIDGRQISSLGATFADMVEVFQSYGAVNACNLDGGSSSMMWYRDGYINNCASVVGIRPVPTAVLVLKEGAGGDG